MHPDLLALIVTLKLATLVTLVLALIGTPIAWWLSQSTSKARVIIEPLIALPIVLPPTVLGFYFLVAFAPDQIIGGIWLKLVGTPLAFTFSSLVIASCIYSLPFYIQPLQLAFQSINRGFLEAASTLGASPLKRFFYLIVPLSRRGFITAGSLAFAHTIGEFGIILMIGGSIPGETRVLSIALFDHVESLNYQNAHMLALGLVIFSFLLLLAIYTLNRAPQEQNRGLQSHVS